MELVVTEVQGGVDGFEWLKVDVHFLLFAFVCHYGAAVNHQTIMRHYRRQETPNTPKPSIPDEAQDVVCVMSSHVCRSLTLGE